MKCAKHSVTELTMSFFEKQFKKNLSLKENCPHLFSVDVFRDVHATLGRHSELGTTPAVISRLGVSFGLYSKSSNRLEVENTDFLSSVGSTGGSP